MCEKAKKVCSEQLPFYSVALSVPISLKTGPTGKRVTAQTPGQSWHSAGDLGSHAVRHPVAECLAQEEPECEDALSANGGPGSFTRVDLFTPPGSPPGLVLL